MLDKLVQAHTGLLSRRGIRLQAELSPDVFVLGSEEMIETVIENLIDNAASYAPDASEITVRLRQVGGSARIEVSDAGPGVPPAQLEQIFERYFSSRRAGLDRARLCHGRRYLGDSTTLEFGMTNTLRDFSFISPR